MRFRHLLSPILVAAVLAVPRADGATPNVALEVVTTANQPMYMFHAGDDRLFILERGGVIRIFKPGVGVLQTPFLDISALVAPSNERGLYAIAFHPNYATNGFFYVSYYGVASGGSTIARYHVSGNPDVADPASEAIVFAQMHPSGTHVAGQLAFGADGYLYLSIGDGGGGSHDLPCNAQRNDKQLGKMLRFDVNQNMNTPPYHGIPPDNPWLAPNDPLDEINDLVWAKGFRNPFRFSFDRLTGDLLLGDVGEGSWEEVDFHPGGTPGGQNYGWKVMEGESCHDPDPIDEDCPPTTPSCFSPLLTPPVHVYPHTEGCAVIGGFVYRGSAIPDLYGRYVFGDFCTGKIYALEQTSPGVWGNKIELATLNGHVITFGEDVAGELYVGDLAKVYRFITNEGRKEQSTGQQGCITSMNLGGVNVEKKRGRLNADCVRFGGQRKLSRLGLPPGSQTLRACLDTDPGGRVARSLAQLATRETGACHAPLPDFGYVPAASVGPAGVRAATRLAEALLGPDVDAALVFEDQNLTGARCQAEVAKRSQFLLEAIWQRGREGKKGHLRGRFGPKAGTAEELADRVLTYVGNNATGGIQTRLDRLVGGIGLNCGGQSLPALFPGECASAATSGPALAACIHRSARCNFCRSFEAFDGLTIDCDGFDDGAANFSCPTDAELVCSVPGSGVNWAATGVDCPHLQDYRLFTDPSDPTGGADGGIPYDLTTPLFSDYAQKYRFVFLPAGTHATYDADDPFDFPVGTVIAKTFSFAHDLRNLALGERVVETRLLIHRAGGWEGLPYVWTADMSDAVLTPGGAGVDVDWIDVSGNPRSTTYQVPTTEECGHCHSAGPGDSPIGPKARLLNKPYPYPGGAQNQLDHWSAIGALVGAPPSGLAPRLPVWNDPLDGTLEQRARAYLESNCAHCHNPGGRAAFTELYLRHDQPLDLSYGLCKIPIGSDGGSGFLYDVVPGNPAQSILPFRMNSAVPTIRMPELSKSVVHDEGVALVQSWIASLPGGCP